MKLGTENRTTTIIAIVLFAIAIPLLIRMWSGAGHPASAPPASPPPNPALAPAHPAPP